jgi:GH24 family phage-related lysozyme (muramidase)
MLTFHITIPQLIRNSIVLAILLFGYILYANSVGPPRLERTIIEEICDESVDTLVTPVRVTQGVIGVLTTPKTHVKPKSRATKPHPVSVKSTPVAVATPTTRKVSDYEGMVWFMKSFERFSPRAFSDHKQITYGFGNKAKYLGEAITYKKANELFISDINNRYANLLRDYPNLKDDRCVALILTNLMFNIGSPGVGLNRAIKKYDPNKKATVIRLCNYILQYTRASGQVLPGLVKRRKAEVAIIKATKGQRQILYKQYQKKNIELFSEYVAH